MLIHCLWDLVFFPGRQTGGGKKRGGWEVGSKGGVVKGGRKEKGKKNKVNRGDRSRKWIESLDRKKKDHSSVRPSVRLPSVFPLVRSFVRLFVRCLVFFLSSHKVELTTYLWKKFLAWCELFLKSMKQSKLFLILRTKLDMMPDPLKMVGSWANRATWIA